MSFVRFRANLGRHRALWAALAVALACIFYVLATTNTVYETTSPKHLAERVFGEEVTTFQRPFGFSLHVALRKLYSVGAFGLIAFCAQLAVRRPRGALARNAILLSVYSAVIEFGQYAGGVREGLPSNAFDVLCGAIGGWLGAVFALRPCRRDPEM